MEYFFWHQKKYDFHYQAKKTVKTCQFGNSFRQQFFYRNIIEIILLWEFFDIKKIFWSLKEMRDMMAQIK